eukprot:4099241-Pyramimonas_sp.AAC.1
MRVPPLGPSIELPTGPRNAVLGAGTACEFCHWDLRWSSLWGHEALHWAQEPRSRSAAETSGGIMKPLNAVLGARAACGGTGTF